MKLDPKHLTHLSEIVEAGSFQSAADRLGLTQPALSRNMQKLEERLGAPIFQRDGRRSTPNSLGLELARSGLAIKIAQEQASNLADLVTTGSAGQLRIGAPPIIAGKFLTDSISTFIVDNPSCRIELRTGFVIDLHRMLERGQIDIVIGPQSLSDPAVDLDYSLLVDDRVGIMCRNDHPLASKSEISVDDLSTQKWLIHSRNSLLRQQTEAAMIALGIQEMHVLCESDSIRSSLEITSTTDLLTFMPVAPTNPYLGDELTFLNFDHPQFHRPIGIIRRKSTPLSPVAVSFLKKLKSAWAD